jgi:hypothetical protein
VRLTFAAQLGISVPRALHAGSGVAGVDARHRVGVDGRGFHSSSSHCSLSLSGITSTAAEATTHRASSLPSTPKWSAQQMQKTDWRTRRTEEERVLVIPKRERERALLRAQRTILWDEDFLMCMTWESPEDRLGRRGSSRDINVIGHI